MSLAESTTIANEVAACGGAGGMDLRPDFAALSHEDQLSLVLAAWQSPLPRLLVFDSCDSEETLTQWRPASGSCRVLVTSRRALWDLTLGVQVLDLDVLPHSDSRSLLERYRPAATEGDAGALADIAAELGQLPLALHLAGSYLRRYLTATSPAAYLDQLRASPVIEHRSLTAAGISPTRHIQSIAATFAISVDRLAADDPADDLPRRCLIHAAYLAPGEAIPRNLLLATLQLSTSPDDAIQLEDALQRLAALGLAQLGRDGSPRLHRLVAAFVQDRLDDLEILQHVELVVGALLAPRKFADTLLTQAKYEPHLRVLTDRASHGTTLSPQGSAISSGSIWGGGVTAIAPSATSGAPWRSKRACSGSTLRRPPETLTTSATPSSAPPRALSASRIWNARGACGTQ